LSLQRSRRNVPLGLPPLPGLEPERPRTRPRRPLVLATASAGRPYDGLIWQLAMAMPQGYWEWHGHHRSLLAHAEGIGCARFGLLLPEKMKRQREHGVPPPPA
jgi:hypothetical protein